MNLGENLNDITAYEFTEYRMLMMVTDSDLMESLNESKNSEKNRLKSFKIVQEMDVPSHPSYHRGKN